MRLRLVLIAAFVVLLNAGAGAAVLLTMRDEPGGALDTELAGVSVSVAPDLPARPTPEPEPTADKLCWPFFGGDPQRSLSRPDQQLGLPSRKSLWARGMGAYMEYPPSYCDGVLYVSTFAGETFALDAETGKLKWKRRAGGPIASTPAIAGDRVIVSSHDGTVTALDRSNGKPLWQVRHPGEGRVLTGRRRRARVLRLDRRAAVRGPVATGRVRWAYDTGGRINASPSVWGPRVCITTYSGSVFCLRKTTGEKLWSTYVSRDSFRNESFYASPSTDGQRLYTVARSGKVVALDARDGDIVWTGRVGGLGYTTPAVAHGKVFVGGFDGRLRAYQATTGRELWQTSCRRKDPRLARCDRRPRVRRHPGAAHLRGAGLGRAYRLAAADGQVLARDRDGADLLLLGQRHPRRLPRSERDVALRRDDGMAASPQRRPLLCRRKGVERPQPQPVRAQTGTRTH